MEHILDLEVYPNYIMLGVKNAITGVINQHRGLGEIKNYLKYFWYSDLKMITFNGLAYDLILLEAILKGNSHIYELSVDLINTKSKGICWREKSL